MKCILIHTGPGLTGPLVNIREACNSHYTWIFKDTLGLFHLTSQRGWGRPSYPHSSLISLSPNSDLRHLVALPILSPLCTHLLFCSFFCASFCYWNSVFPYPHVSHSPTVSSVCGSSELRSHWGRWRDEHLSHPSPSASPHASLHPARPAGCQCAEEIEMRLTMRQLVLLWA